MSNFNPNLCLVIILSCLIVITFNIIMSIDMVIENSELMLLEMVVQLVHLQLLGRRHRLTWRGSRQD